MKRFLIPAFFVVDVADYENVQTACEIAVEMQSAANNVKFGRTLGTHILLLDEGRLDRKVPIIPGETELPHTFDWQPPEVNTEAADEPTCICGSRLFNDDGDCQKCGLWTPGNNGTITISYVDGITAATLPVLVLTLNSSGQITAFTPSAAPITGLITTGNSNFNI